MSTELLLTLQVILVLVIAAVILLLMLRRQKKTISHLKTILTTVKDDISGDSLTQYLQSEIDDTTAHCGTEIITVRADYKPEDLAISIRYAALQVELALLQDHVGSANTPWREKIKNYNIFAAQLSESIESRIEAACTLLDEVHAEEISSKNGIIEALSNQKQMLEEQLANLKPLAEMIGELSEGDESRNDLELKLYKSLLALCENFENSEKLREVVFLLHESFHEQHSEKPATATDNMASQNNTKILNNIIDKQNETISILREQIKSLEDNSTRDGLMKSVEKLQSSVDESGQCIQEMGNQQDEDSELAEGSLEDLIVQVEKKNREIQTLQKSFTELETRYLALYREKKNPDTRSEN